MPPSGMCQQQPMPLSEFSLQYSERYGQYHPRSLHPRNWCRSHQRLLFPWNLRPNYHSILTHHLLLQCCLTAPRCSTAPHCSAVLRCLAAPRCSAVLHCLAAPRCSSAPHCLAAPRCLATPRCLTAPRCLAAAVSLQRNLRLLFHLKTL